MSRYLSTKGVADLLKVAPETVRLYARQGRIPFETTPGGHRRYEAEAVLEAMAAEQRLSIASSAGRVARNRVNLSGQLPRNPMAMEVASLASAPRREPLPTPVANNAVHGALMRWAEPARVPAGSTR